MQRHRHSRFRKVGESRRDASYVHRLWNPIKAKQSKAKQIKVMWKKTTAELAIGHFCMLFTVASLLARLSIHFLRRKENVSVKSILLTLFDTRLSFITVCYKYAACREAWLTSCAKHYTEKKIDTKSQPFSKIWINNGFVVKSIRIGVDSTRKFNLK